jgi:hypothetical protein
MKHRDVYTLEGGKNMQQTSLGRAMRYLVAVLVVLSLFAFLGCSSDDDEPAIFDLTNAAVPVSSSTVAAVQGQAINLPAGTVFNAGAGAVTLTFTGANTATFSRAGAASSNAAVAFASCTFLVAAGGFIPTGTYNFPTCNFLITANDVEQGGATVLGTLVLVLVGPTGSATSAPPITVQVAINDDGLIVINNVVTPIDVDAGGTGISGVTGG